MSNTDHLKLLKLIETAPLASSQKEELLNLLSKSSDSSDDSITPIYQKLDKILANTYDRKAKQYVDTIKKIEYNIKAIDLKYETELETLAIELREKLKKTVKTLGQKNMIWEKHHEKMEKIRHAWAKALNDENRKAILGVQLD